MKGSDKQSHHRDTDKPEDISTTIMSELSSTSSAAAQHPAASAALHHRRVVEQDAVKSHDDGTGQDPLRLLHYCDAHPKHHRTTNDCRRGGDEDDDYDDRDTINEVVARRREGARGCGQARLLLASPVETAEVFVVAAKDLDDEDSHVDEHDDDESSSLGPQHHHPPPHRLGATIAGVAGNVLEWYDFAVFGYLSDVLGQVFFPPTSTRAAAAAASPPAPPPSSSSPFVSNATANNSSSVAATDDNTATILAFAVFGGAFLMRPVGGLWLGYMGDKFGRRSALVTSIFLMAVPTFALGCLPTYQQVGSLAIWLLVVVRLLQGLSVGGQLVTSLVFTLEQYPRRHWGWYGSCVMASANAGSLLGSLVGFALRSFLTPEQLKCWGWRIPFLSGILVGGAGCYLLSEGGGPHDVEGAAAHRHSRAHHEHGPPATSLPLASANPICAALQPDNLRSLLAASLVPTLWSGGFYLTFVWMAVYMEELVESPIPHAFGVNTVSMLLSLCLFFPLAGRASDRFGRRAVMTLGGVGCAFLGPLALRLIASSSGSGSDKASKTGIGWALAGQLALGIAVSCWGAPMCAWLVEGFEPQARLTSGSIGYNVAQAVAGGSSPALATYLVDRLGPTGPGWIFVALSCLALTALWIVAPPPSKEAPSTAHTCHGRLRRHKDGEFSEVPRTDDDTASLSWNIEMTHSNKY